MLQRKRKELKFRDAEFEEHRETARSKVHNGLMSGGRRSKITEERRWPSIQGDANALEKKKMKTCGLIWVSSSSREGSKRDAGGKRQLSEAGRGK